MKSIISRLFDNELYESESLVGREERKKKKIEETRGKAHDALWNTLSRAQQDLFRAWELENGIMNDEEVEAAYVRGFKTGALLGFEVSNFDFGD